MDHCQTCTNSDVDHCQTCTNSDVDHCQTCSNNDVDHSLAGTNSDMVDILADTDSDLDPSEPECVCVRGLVGSVSGGVVVSDGVGRTDPGMGGEWNTHTHTKSSGSRCLVREIFYVDNLSLVDPTAYLF